MTTTSSQHDGARLTAVDWPTACQGQLGYDLEELVVSNVTVADGRRMPVPQIDSLRIAFHPKPDAPPDRSFPLGAIVLGDQCLMGCIALQALDLVLDPLNECITGRHEGGPLYRA